MAAYMSRPLPLIRPEICSRGAPILPLILPPICNRVAQKSEVLAAMVAVAAEKKKTTEAKRMN